ncbi:MAG: aspartyl protease family protein [bacterium]|nr:aspartyl protease family protein [bacterium]
MPAPSATGAPIPSLTAILNAHVAALAAMHLHEPATEEIVGTLVSGKQVGEFHAWRSGNEQRRDEQLGIRSQRTLRVDGRLFVQNASGETRELTGLLARRQATQDFIDSGAFAHHPEDVRFLERATLPDGRVVYRLQIAPPHGESYVIGLDAATWLIDEESFIEHDAPFTLTFSDYRVIDGDLIPFREVDSNGDHAYDVVSHVERVLIDTPIDPSIFAALRPIAVSISAPVTVPFREEYHLIFTTVTIAGKPFNFLIDSGSQGDVVSPSVAAALGLTPQGSLEVTGAARAASRGVVELPDISVGGAAMPAHLATVLDLSSIFDGATPVDGVLGYPFFAAAEVRVDPTQHTLTIAKPGTLALDGEKIAVDTDRELPEIHASVNRVPGRFVVDTGDTQELLVYRNFVDAHPGVIQTLGSAPATNRGVGGSTDSIAVIVDSLQIGSIGLFNRYANVILQTTGAFADRSDSGNIGYGSLRNFVMTFDLADRALYLQRARDFDDGRFRSVYEPQ